MNTDFNLSQKLDAVQSSRRVRVPQNAAQRTTPLKWPTDTAFGIRT